MRDNRHLFEKQGAPFAKYILALLKFLLERIGPTWLHDSEMSDNLPFCVVRNGPWMQAARQGRSPCDLASEAARLHRDL